MPVKIPTNEDLASLRAKARELMPWRKGPFLIGELFIDSEWRSNIKIDILKSELEQIGGKVVADIGCNNGYYMFKMLEYSPRKIIGFDPSNHCAKQFYWLNSYAKTNIEFYEKSAAELVEFTREQGLIDVIFCLGVLYHRADPVGLLKQLKQSLAPGGYAIIDTLIISHDEPVALFPDTSYAAMSNVYFIPSLSALENMCRRAKFKNFKLIAINPTTTDEQRKTEWINGHSLEDFLADSTHTKEGYEAPKRAYIRIEI